MDGETDNKKLNDLPKKIKQEISKLLDLYLPRTIPSPPKIMNNYLLHE